MLALVTGSTDGIGFATAEQLASKGFSVLIHGRNEQRCNDSVEKIKLKYPEADLDYVTADFSSLSQVEKTADELNSRLASLDVLINNAGVFMPEKIITEDGFESTFQINYLAPFFLTLKLQPLLIKSGKGRIINVSSIAHKWADFDFGNLNGEKYYSGENSYALSKLCNILFTYKHAVEMEKFNVTVNALHPGVIGTKLLKIGWGMGGESIRKGSETSVYLAASEEVKNVTGKYFINKKETPSSPISYNKELQEQLWNESLKMLNID